VGETYARARALCEGLDRPREIVPVLYGQWVYHLLKGPLRQAREIAAELLQRGEEGADAVITAMGYRLSGQACCHLGELLAARAHLEQALARFDPAYRPFYLSLSAQDPLVTLLIYLSCDLLNLGYLDQARSRSGASVEEAHKLGHAYSLAIALFGACFVAWATRSCEALQVRALSLGSGLRTAGLSKLMGALNDAVPTVPPAGIPRMNLQSSASNALASFRTGVSKPSANHGCAHRRLGRARISLQSCRGNRLPGMGAGRGWANHGGYCDAPGRRGRIPRDRSGDAFALLSHIARRRRGPGEGAGPGARPSRRGRAPGGRD
jgi:hypothetical protein